uniref:GDSL-type esterase/lipase family protein n=1 Tax=Prevotella sp. TaxID=59823 RepID=UPI004029DEF9
MTLKQIISNKTLSTLLLVLFCLTTLQLPAAAKRKKGAAQPVRVACVGNSITYGTGIADREHFSYPVQLQQMLGNGYVVGNFGKPGATLLYKGHRPYVEQPEFKEALRFKGDIAVIHLGINDTDPRNWPNYRDEFVKDYLSIMDSLRAANPKVRFILARMTPIADRHPRFQSGTKQWHDEIQTAIETVARVSGAELIDFHEPLYPYPNLLPDAIHPNPEGAGILAKTVYGGITGNYGGLSMSSLYADYMVLQRDVPLDIHGTANTGEKITVEIGGQKASTTADNQGKWSVVLSPMQATEDLTLTITAGKQRKVFSHVAVGEVWLCSGQSNMAFMLCQAESGKQDIAAADDPQLRLFDMKGRWETYDVAWPASCLDSLNHLQYFHETTWQPSTSTSASRFSAVGYYYGRMLRQKLGVPVGLICNAVGGAPTEAWVDRNSLETSFPNILSNWLQNDFIQDWVRGRAAKNLTNDQTKLGRHPYEPCYLYESGILPLQRYPIKGVIWYQGESNAHNKDAHAKLFSLLVNGWRQNWNNPDMPFYFVQLSSLNRPSWPWFRDSQLRLMKEISNTGMAVSSDCGDSLDVHPRRKQPVGERLARWALAKTYGQDITPSGPVFSSVTRQADALIVSFLYADGLQTSDGKSPSCFEIAEEDGLFQPATATIEGNTVRLTSPTIKHPRYVRYAWQPFTRANLVNADHLPASTFRGEARTN